MKTKNIIVISVLFILILNSCGNKVSSIPDSPVRINLNLTAEFNTFVGILDYRKFTEPNFMLGVDYVGYGGVLVNINMDNQYCAYDMACPYEVDPKVRVYPDDSGVYAVCEKCGSKFDLAFGTGAKVSGAATENLKRCRTYVRQSGTSKILEISRWK